MIDISNLTKVTEFRLKLYPKNFSTMRNFYERKLGFPIVHEWSDKNKGVMFKVGDAILELLGGHAEKGPSKGADISLKVPDVWKLWEKLKDYDKIIFKLRENAWGDVSFCITDPEGFQITFFTNK